MQLSIQQPKATFTAQDVKQANTHFACKAAKYNNNKKCTYSHVEFSRGDK